MSPTVYGGAFRVGDFLEVTDDGKVLARTAVNGFAPNGDLLIRLPNDLKFTVGDEWTLYCNRDEGRYTIKVKVRGIWETSKLRMHPISKASKTQWRVYTRIDVAVPAKLTYIDPQTKAEIVEMAQTTNMSATGCRVKTVNKFPLNETIRFHLSLPDYTMPVMVLGAVLSVQDAPDGGYFEGVRFLLMDGTPLESNPSHPALAKIETFVNREQNRQLRTKIINDRFR